MNNPYFTDAEYIEGIGWSTDFFTDEPVCNNERPAFMLDSQKFLQPMTLLEQNRAFLENEALVAELYEIADEKGITLNGITDVLKMVGLTEAQLCHETVKMFISQNINDTW